MDTPHPYHRDATVFIFLVALFLGAVIVLFLFFVLRTERSISSYAECAASRTSKILEIYPEICVTAGGKRFVNPNAEKLVPPSVPSPTPAPVSFSLPAEWKEVTPDPSVVALDTDVITHEFVKNGEKRPYPIGRVTIQYTKGANRLTPPESVFDPESETVGTVSYSVVVGEENGYQYRVYYGTSPDTTYHLRIFTHFATDIESAEQKAIIASLQFGQLPTETPAEISR